MNNVRDDILLSNSYYNLGAVHDPAKIYQSDHLGWLDVGMDSNYVHAGHLNSVAGTCHNETQIIIIIRTERGYTKLATNKSEDELLVSALLKFANR